MPTTPNFAVLFYEDMAEFSAALPVLLDLWTAAISDQRRDLKAQLPSLDAVWSTGRLPRRAGAAFARNFQQLQRHQVALQEAISDAQSMLSFVHSAAICRTARYREVLDRLSDAAGIPQLVRDLDAQIIKVDALYERVQAVARRLEERAQHRYRTLVEVTLAFLAATSLADLFQLWNSTTGSRTQVVEVGIVLSVGLLLTLIAFRSGRRSRV
jgi:hypothetical protein